MSFQCYCFLWDIFLYFLYVLLKKFPHSSMYSSVNADFDKGFFSFLGIRLVILSVLLSLLLLLVIALLVSLCFYLGQVSKLCHPLSLAPISPFVVTCATPSSAFQAWTLVLGFYHNLHLTSFWPTTPSLLWSLSVASPLLVQPFCPFWFEQSPGLGSLHVF